MTTPIEDRVTALETWRTGTVDPALAQAQTALTALRSRVTALESGVAAAGPRIAALEANYADAVKRFQKAERLVARLRVILRMLWLSTAGDRAGYLQRMDPGARQQAAVDLEEIGDLENISLRGDPDEWREPTA